MDDPFLMSITGMFGLSTDDVHEGDTVSSAAPTAPGGVEDPRFRRVEAEYARLRAEMEAGRLRGEDFDAALRSRIFEHGGRY